MDIGIELSLKDILTQTDPHVNAIKHFYFNYLAKPHPNLGRSGAICPFVPLALKFEKISTLLIDSKATAQQVKTILAEKSAFMETKTKDSAFVLFLPHFTPKEIDDIQIELKPSFVAKGLMIGEFHLLNKTPGIHNPSFFPLRSELPCLAIRHMVREDLPFMLKKSYTVKQTIIFLLYYLKKFPEEICAPTYRWIFLPTLFIFLAIIVAIKFG